LYVFRGPNQRQRTVDKSGEEKRKKRKEEEDKRRKILRFTVGGNRRGYG